MRKRRRACPQSLRHPSARLLRPLSAWALAARLVFALALASVGAPLLRLEPVVRDHGLQRLRALLRRLRLLNSGLLFLNSGVLRRLRLLQLPREVFLLGKEALLLGTEDADLALAAGSLSEHLVPWHHGRSAAALLAVAHEATTCPRAPAAARQAGARRRRTRLRHWRRRAGPRRRRVDLRVQDAREHLPHLPGGPPVVAVQHLAEVRRPGRLDRRVPRELLREVGRRLLACVWVARGQGPRAPGVQRHGRSGRRRRQQGSATAPL
mmetsp:Transcript_19886/g.56470  ORF Transcript_19886/g.56470 Transcript_19886/m.56470 type:complete len:266 (-) Transcript_19886:22-819(-)